MNDLRSTVTRVWDCRAFWHVLLLIYCLLFWAGMVALARHGL